MVDLDFMGYKRVILKSDQEPSVVAYFDAVKKGWHGEVVLEALSPRATAQVMERAVQSKHGLARTVKDFLVG